MNRLAHLAVLMDLGARYARGEDVRAELAKLGEAMGGPPQLSLVPDASEAAAVSAPADLKATAARVFEHWQARTGHRKARLTPERAQKILARLRQGYSEAELRSAVDGCVGSKFHSGDNEDGTVYDDIGLIFRNGENVEKFARKAGATFDTPQTPHDARRAELLAEAEEHLREGRTSEYNRIVRSVRAGKAG